MHKSLAENWPLIQSDLDSAINHWKNARLLLADPDLGTHGLRAYMVKMAVLHAMQCGFVSFERGMQRVLTAIGEALPLDENDLLKRLARPLPSRPAILDQEGVFLADKARKFKYEAERNYDSLDVKARRSEIEAAFDLAGSLTWRIVSFREELALFEPAP